MKPRSAQQALAVVSYLFLAVGLLALALMIRHTLQGAFHFNFGILAIGVFFGLRRYSRMWRMCALLFTWYGMATVAITLYICVSGEPPRTAPLLHNHYRLSTVPANWLALPLIMVLLVTLWQHRVLMHPAVRRLFNDEAPPLSPEAETPPVGAELDMPS
jgi:hypothetical protein